MAKLSFSVSARTASLIGLENFSNVEGAVTELVKNSYDADSVLCFVAFVKDDTGAWHMILADLGCGMDEETIERCWMRIGTDDKVRNYISKDGRIKSGAKGIGRFALNRLGRYTKMITATNENRALSWIVDWTSFNNNDDVANVTADLNVVDFSSFKSSIEFLVDAAEEADDNFCFNRECIKRGTYIEVSLLNDDWNKDSMKSLCKTLRSIIPPFDWKDFRVFFFAEGYQDLSGLVKNSDFDDYDYKVIAHYDSAGRKIDYTIERNELDLTLLIEKYSKLFELNTMKSFPYRREDFINGSFSSSKPLDEISRLGNSEKEIKAEKDLGDFDFSFYFMKNTYGENSGEGDRAKYPYRNFVAKNRRSWWQQFGGVKIYRDNFRVRNYGEGGDDWLKLGQRQAQSPSGAGQRLGGYKIRPNQIVGAVEISRIANKYLEDKSGREGLQENDCYRSMVKIILSMLEIFEEDRNTVMYNLSQLYDKENPKQRTKAAADEAEASNNYSQDNYEKIKAGYQVLKKEAEERESEIQLLRNLASTGLVISSFAHELNSIDGLLVLRVEIAEKMFRNIVGDDVLEQLPEDSNPLYLIQDIKNGDERIKSWLEFSLNSVKREKRRNVIQDVNAYFNRFKSTWAEVCREYNIKMDVVNSPNPAMIRAFTIDLDTIFNNLLSNSIYSIRATKDPINRNIIITIRDEEESISVDFVDTGLGLAPKYVDDKYKIFNSFETSKFNEQGEETGTGLGLYIVKTTLDGYKDSSIVIMDVNERGFGLTVKFNKANDE